jgi:HAD superfamily hydrolase (TIGR01509 family)
MGRIRGVIFDLDGTITKPYLDFKRIKREIGMPEDEPILEHLEKISEQERKKAEEILERHELEAAKNSELNPGVEKLLSFISKLGLKTGIITRNCHSSCDIVFARHRLSFDVVICRGDAAPKPSAEPVMMSSRRLGIPPAEFLLVGDYAFDIIAGRKAGAKTAYLTNGKPIPEGIPYDYAVDSPDKLISIIEELTS